MRITYLLVLALIGCSGVPEQKPTANAVNASTYAPMTRHIASKNDLLYTYRVGLDYPNGYDKALADATKWCAKHQLGVAERIHPQCSVYDNRPTLCSVSFKCQ